MFQDRTEAMLDRRGPGRGPGPVLTLDTSFPYQHRGYHLVGVTGKAKGTLEGFTVCWEWRLVLKMNGATVLCSARLSVCWACRCVISIQLGKMHGWCDTRPMITFWATEHCYLVVILYFTALWQRHMTYVNNRVSRLLVLDCGMTFHLGFGGRDSPSILLDDPWKHFLATESPSDSFDL